MNDHQCTPNSKRKPPSLLLAGGQAIAGCTKCRIVLTWDIGQCNVMYHYYELSKQTWINRLSEHTCITVKPAYTKIKITTNSLTMATSTVANTGIPTSMPLVNSLTALPLKI